MKKCEATLKNQMSTWSTNWTKQKLTNLFSIASRTENYLNRQWFMYMTIRLRQMKSTKILILNLTISSVQFYAKFVEYLTINQRFAVPLTWSINNSTAVTNQNLT